jgi:hypothetical protein
MSKTIPGNPRVRIRVIPSGHPRPSQARPREDGTQIGAFTQRHSHAPAITSQTTWVVLTPRQIIGVLLFAAYNCVCRYPRNDEQMQRVNSVGSGLSVGGEGSRAQQVYSTVLVTVCAKAWGVARCWRGRLHECEDLDRLVWTPFRRGQSGAVVVRGEAGWANRRCWSTWRGGPPGVGWRAPRCAVEMELAYSGAGSVMRPGAGSD